jgi:hypothetical protein
VKLADRFVEQGAMPLESATIGPFFSIVGAEAKGKPCEWLPGVL